MRSWFEIVGDVGSTNDGYVLSQPSNDIYSDTGIVLRTTCALCQAELQTLQTGRNSADEPSRFAWRVQLGLYVSISEEYSIRRD